MAAGNGAFFINALVLDSIFRIMALANLPAQTMYLFTIGQMP